MRPGELLFDTNAVIAWLSNDALLSQRYRGRDVWLPSVVVGELYYGVEMSRRQTLNEEQLAKLLAYAEVVEIGSLIARRYGAVKSTLRAAGTPIPDNDLWIAATAIEHQLTLVTKDAHFGKVEGLSIATW